MGGSAPRRAGHLPVETTSFVDRRGEQAAGRELLSRARLVTLTGPGGVGKTRLAARIAARAERTFPDGVRFVHLAGLREPELVPLAVADALGLHDHSAGPPADALVAHVRDRKVLLVLDNCEHLLRACARLAAALLRGTTGVRILATSRHRLGLTEENLLDVRPLPVPDPDGDLSAADGYPALALFADRAAAVVPGFALTAGNRAAVARLCRRLDGLPLAIELAAVRMRVLGVEQLLERLDDRYRLLTSGSPAALPRHRTLRAAVDWSHELCTAREQLVWARLSVPAGGFDLETAEAVCADGDLVHGADVLDAIAGLVDKSVLSREPGPDGVRYRLLDTLRHYGLEMLRGMEGEELATRRRHRDWMLRRATACEQAWFGPGQREIVARLRADQDNLRAALDFSLRGAGGAAAASGPDGVFGVGAPGAASVMAAGPGAAARSASGSTASATSADPREGATPTPADTLAGLRLAGTLAGPGAAARPAPGSTASATSADPREGATPTPADTLAGLRLAGTLWFYWHACGAPREGRYWVERALEANPEPTSERARGLWVAGLLAGCPEDLTRGLRRAEEARELARGLGDAAEAAHAAYVIGVIRLFADDLCAALAHFEAGVARGPVPGQHLSLVGLDQVELACALGFLGHADRAVEVCEKTLRLCEEHGEEWVRSYALRMLALAHTVKQDWPRAERYAREALRLKLAVNDLIGLALTLDLTARIATERSAHERAAVLLGGADRAWAAVDQGRWGSEALNSLRRDTESRAGRVLGSTAFTAAYDRGAALTLPELVGHALQEPGLPDVTPPAPDRPQVRLTPREAQVAELVAEGLANQQIADRLVIARRTAEGHVERILNKLGFNTRTQIATWVTAQR
ncbi:LuxR C-terminal-related transcriptional regulator [Streptomyces sp. SAI-127]|uniref:LuxR C-terminal-related transcriptional regulator n=1 Tax=Streptomyces sp. SAI-127 TaxID=2940543 RepID=UPI0024751953|nr:LuxR C-terminal-related transcriptional regulator [Streptomyces sp. SAI-127]MDH6487657.1 putative ATPase/DNA-binding CsgD family transcriptional regulator/tetratricopeptide (TPR) repeat protein [Streptomyces sp. SAI-127]